jgi:hypothetical protein
MTPDIERHAAAVGIGYNEYWDHWEATKDQLERFAALVRAEALDEEGMKLWHKTKAEHVKEVRNEALEEAAKVCVDTALSSPYDEDYRSIFYDCADAIRAMKA